MQLEENLKGSDAREKYTLTRNMLLNVVALAVTALAPLIAMPWYIQLLSPEQWGLVSFLITLQLTLGLLDSGMSQVLLREVAIRYSSGQKSKALTLVYGYERIYISLALFAMAGVWLLSGSIVERWLAIPGSIASEANMAVLGAGLLFLAQFPGTVYRSALLGTPAQAGIAMLTSGFALLRFGGAVFMLFLFPKVECYIYWNFAILLVESFLRRWVAMRHLGAKHSFAPVDWFEVGLTRKFAISMALATTLGVLLNQADKLIASGTLELHEFGYYSALASVAVGTTQLLYPAYYAIYPQLVGSNREPGKIPNWLRFLLSYVIFLYLPVVFLLGWLAPEITEFIFRGNPSVDGVELVSSFRILMAGSALYAIASMFNLYWQAHAYTGRILLSNILSLIAVIVVAPSVIARFGISGAADTWVLVNIVLVLFGVMYELRKFLHLERHSGTR